MISVLKITEERRSDYVGQVAAPLRNILQKYYLVNGKNFFESSQQDVFKHQVLHLSKMVNKFARYSSNSSDSNAEQIVKFEVAPDLLIYAQEIWLKAAEECWRPAADLVERQSALKTLLLHDRDAAFETLLTRLSAASATLADVCDCNDHSQSCTHDLSSQVAIPFTDAAATLFKHFEMDPDVVYQQRLQSMVAKYDGWILPAKGGVV